MLLVEPEALDKLKLNGKNELQNHSIISANTSTGSAEINVVISVFIGAVCVVINMQ